MMTHVKIPFRAHAGSPASEIFLASVFPNKFLKIFGDLTRSWAAHPDDAKALRDALISIYPLHAPKPRALVAGDRVVVGPEGLSAVAAAAGKEATIDRVESGYYLRFDDYIAADDGIRSREWFADEDMVSPAPKAQESKSNLDTIYSHKDAANVRAFLADADAHGDYEEEFVEQMRAMLAQWENTGCHLVDQVEHPKQPKFRISYDGNYGVEQYNESWTPVVSGRSKVEAELICDALNNANDDSK